MIMSAVIYPRRKELLENVTLVFTNIKVSKTVCLVYIYASSSEFHCKTSVHLSELARYSKLKSRINLDHYFASFC